MGIWRALETSSPPIYSCHTFADFPDPKLLVPLKLRTLADGPFQYLVDYGGIRYLFLLTYNETTSDCEENKRLRKVYEAMEKKEETQLYLAVRECMELFWVYLKEDYEARLTKGRDSVAPCKRAVVRLQVQTVDGTLRATQHDSELGYEEQNPQFSREFEVNNPPRASYESFADFLDIDLFVPLAFHVQRAWSLRYLLEYGGIRYSFCLKYNGNEKDCIENIRLKEIREAIRKEDRCLIFQCISKCLELFWPYLQRDHVARLEKDEEKREPNATSTVSIQLQTINGTMHAKEHTGVLHYQKAPIANPFPDMQLFSKNEIETISKLCGDRVHKVTINGNYYCLKPIYRSYDDHFLRELRLLQRMPVHPNLIRLVGLTEAGDGKVDGLVLPYIPGITLDRIMWITASQGKKWKKQISEVVHFLHSQNIVWGDVKAANVLIDKRSDDAIIIDFGGGGTRRWVDRELAGTKGGDLQGLERILNYIDKKSTGFSYAEHKYRVVDFSYMEV